MDKRGSNNPIISTGMSTGGSAAGSQVQPLGAPQARLFNPANDLPQRPSSQQNHKDIVALLEHHDRAWKKAYGYVEMAKGDLYQVENQLVDIYGNLDNVFSKLQQNE